MLYLKKCGRDIDYKMEKSQNIPKIGKMTNLMTSLSDEDACGGSFNTPYATFETIIFQMPCRSSFYLERCRSLTACKIGGKRASKRQYL